MTEKIYAVTIHVRVPNKAELFKAASAQARWDGMTASQIKEMLEPNNEVNEMACLRMMFDPGASPPGCEILDSTCE